MRIIHNDKLDEAAIASLTSDQNEWVYNALDCCVTLEVFKALESQIDNIAKNTYEFSKSLQAPVLEMTTRGLLVDLGRKAEVAIEFQQKLDRIQTNFDRIITEGLGIGKINWNSPAQLKYLFYEVLGIKPRFKRNANGQRVPTVDRDTLEKIQSDFFAEPLAMHILALRDVGKKLSWLRTPLDKDNRFRFGINIAGTNTGRFSSSISDLGTGNNVQNIDRSLRSVFIADKGMKLCNVDLEQGDARNVAAICWNTFYTSHGEEFAGSYMRACESGDLHTTVSKLIWTDLAWTGDAAGDKKVAEQLFYRQDSYRQMAKKGGHGTNYYGTAPTMAMHLKMPRSIIREFQVNYFSAFPVIGQADHANDYDNWHNYVKQQLKERQQITTLMGRRRYFFGRPTEDETIRAAIAYEPQSLTADEINTGLLRLFRAGKFQLLAQVHDSILLQYPEELEDQLIPEILNLLKVKIELAGGKEFFVPVEAKTGWNWGDLSETNPDGLKKYKGTDTRKRVRSATIIRPSIWNTVI